MSQPVIKYTLTKQGRQPDWLSKHADAFKGEHNISAKKQVKFHVTISIKVPFILVLHLVILMMMELQIVMLESSQPKVITVTRIYRKCW